MRRRLQSTVSYHRARPEVASPRQQFERRLSACRLAANALAETLNLMAIELGGTMTGEHGVGIGKKKYMQAEHGDAYALMAVIKKAVDPQNIMNPGKMVNVN